ncbi:hypothetical protein BC827DRAFT_1156870 [Russula dissimulans]|nr:hypothetical protein BC827DRAFT_1156870 [Russula dissimulans]
MALRQAWCGVVWCGVVWHGGRRGGTGRHVNVCMWACGQAELWPPIATAAVTMLVLPQSQLMLPPLKPKRGKAFKVSLPGRDEVKRATREPMKKRRKEEDRLVKTACLYMRNKDLQCKQDDLERAMAASSEFWRNGS